MPSWKQNFDLEYARAALSDIESLTGAFIFSSTPEGLDYWYQQRFHGLTAEGRARLEAMIKEYESCPA